jgi:Flp pilus assembly protein TadD
LLALLSVVLLAGCSARPGSTLTKRFVVPGEPATRFDDIKIAAAPEQSLEDYASRLRHLQSTPRNKASLLPTIESQDPALARALLALSLDDSADNHILVAAAYRAAGVRDHAYRHYLRALKIDSCASAAHEGVARLWRDWGRPELAVGDAYRAIGCRPHSASAYNTLGTALLALGQNANARRSFEFALRLDTRASYALNNLCYLSLLEGNASAAKQACNQALELEPGMPAARTNLALAHALGGDVATAERLLLESGDVANAQYNLGLLRMSMGRYADAAEAFDQAYRARPSLSEAARRAVQARKIAAGGKE